MKFCRCIFIDVYVVSLFADVEFETSASGVRASSQEVYIAVHVIMLARVLTHLILSRYQPHTCKSTLARKS